MSLCTALMPCYLPHLPASKHVCAHHCCLRCIDCCASFLSPATLQDGSKLEPGAFYLDRQLQSKHLPLAGTGYSSADVDRLWAALEKLAAPAMPQR